MKPYTNTLSPHEEHIARDIVDAAYVVHKTLGPGLLEHVYEVCLCHELQKRNHRCERQVPVPIVYDGVSFDEGFRLDVLVDGMAICEIKAVDIAHDVWHAQILSHLRLTHKRLGFLVNFNVPLIKDGIHRFIL